MRIKECPVCGKKGSIHGHRLARNGKTDKNYRRYFQIAHWDTETKKIRWCYVPIDLGEKLMYG